MLNALLQVYSHRGLDEEVKRLVRLYGPDDVRKSVKANTAKRKGRKAVNDWGPLAVVIQQDAIDWLDGKDPFKLRSNYQLAKVFAEETAGHNAISTQRRLMKKLSGRRKFAVLLQAMTIAELSRPIADYFRTLAALGEDRDRAELMDHLADKALQDLANYREMIGEPDPMKPITMLRCELEAGISMDRSIDVTGLLANLKLASGETETD